MKSTVFVLFCRRHKNSFPNDVNILAVEVLLNEQPTNFGPVESYEKCNNDLSKGFKIL